MPLASRRPPPESRPSPPSRALPSSRSRWSSSLVDSSSRAMIVACSAWERREGSLRAEASSSRASRRARSSPLARKLGSSDRRPWLRLRARPAALRWPPASCPAPVAARPSAEPARSPPLRRGRARQRATRRPAARGPNPLPAGRCRRWPARAQPGGARPRPRRGAGQGQAAPAGACRSDRESRGPPSQRKRGSRERAGRDRSRSAHQVRRQCGAASVTAAPGGEAL